MSVKSFRTECCAICDGCALCVYNYNKYLPIRTLYLVRMNMCNQRKVRRSIVGMRGNDEILSIDLSQSQNVFILTY